MLLPPFPPSECGRYEVEGNCSDERVGFLNIGQTEAEAFELEVKISVRKIHAR